MAALSYEPTLFRRETRPHFKNYIRVKRGLDTVSALIHDFPTLEEDGELPSPLNQQDRVRVLDLPDERQQFDNIATVASLSADQFYSRATTAPEQLTEPEIELLCNRLWLDVSDQEQEASTPVEQWFRSKRGKLFDPVQADAMRKASEELMKRYRNRREEQQFQESLKAMAKARPWVRRLYDELCADSEMHWGYALFLPPNLTSDHDGLLCQFSSITECAIRDMCGGHILQRHFMPYPPAWSLPEEVKDIYREDVTPLDLVGLREEIGFDAAQEQEEEQEQRREREDEESLRAVIHHLRDRFRSMRAGPATTSVRDENGLLSNVLRNAFLVFPRRLVHLLEDDALPDLTWVWAVDPDFNGNDITQPSGYQGYLRVRVPQLANNFYELRRYRPDEYPMETLWTLAQRSLNQAFVSLDERYFDKVASTGVLEIGVDLKPPAE